jgi:hypothetical protein
LIITLAFVALTRDRNFSAGCWLACGLFKFHIVLTLVVLLLSLKRRRFLRGVALVGGALLLISVSISGWPSLTEYPRFLENLSSLPLAGIHPSAMANIRGLLGLLGTGTDNAIRLLVIGIASALVLWCAATSVKYGKLKFASITRLAIGNFVLAAILVSYHLSPSDLSIALLPLGLFAAFLGDHAGMSRWERSVLLGCQCLLLLPPLHVVLLESHVYAYTGVPIVIMFVLGVAAIRNEEELRDEKAEHSRP